MSRIGFICAFVLLVLVTILAGACDQPRAGSQEQGQQVAREFVRVEATFRFDGISGTLRLTDTTSVADGWRYRFEFDSRHAGYGNRTGLVLAEVVTHHTAEITVQAGSVTSAIMDGVYDMVEQRMLSNLQIGLAPIHEVEVYFMESFPVQVGVRIKVGLADGCTTFRDAAVKRAGNGVNIEVTTQRPRDAICTQVYGFFEKNLNLGSDFAPGTVYDLKVNDRTTAFRMP